MKHSESWETCDQCGKIIETGHRIEMKMGSSRIDIGEKRVNLLEGTGIYHWLNTLWLEVDAAFCSAPCITKQFNKIIREYMRAIDSKVDDLTTDLWGGAGPDCRTVPVLAG